MQRFCVMAAVCAAAACGGDDSNCDPSKFSGTYQIHYDEQDGGTCGDIPDENVLVDQNDQSTPGCTVNDDLHDNEACTHDLDITCDDAPDNLRVHEVFHVDSKADGSGASGTVTATATYLSTGAFACSSTYKIKYTKQ